MKKTLLVLLIISFELRAQENTNIQIDSILLGALQNNKAENGLVIVRDLQNLSNNYSTAFTATKRGFRKNTELTRSTIEPGGFILPIMEAFLIDQFNVSTSDSADLEGGKVKMNGKDIYDSEQHGMRETSLNDIIALSSNVGIAKFISKYVSTDEQNKNLLLKINTYLSPMAFPLTDINITSLPFASFGYGIKFSPEDILNFYSNIAINKEIFKSATTTTKIKTSLEEVMKTGTGKILNSKDFQFAGKTATIMAERKNKYDPNQYYSGFVGYYPVENPRYVCMVIIKCRPNAPMYYGAAVAGPICKEILIKAFY